MPERDLLDADGLLRLLAWTSPALPIGAYSYSHGLEWAVEAGLVRTAAALEAWITDALGHGAGWNDALLLAAAHRAALAGDRAALLELIELAAALAPTAELHLETTAQGDAFLKIARDAWHRPQQPTTSVLSEMRGVAHSVALGAVAADVGAPLAPTLLAWLHGFVANLVSAGVRLVPLGQTDGQRVTAALALVILDTTARAEAGSLDDLGSATVMIDWCSMRHESQETRLFRS